MKRSHSPDGNSNAALPSQHLRREPPAGERRHSARNCARRARAYACGPQAESAQHRSRPTRSKNSKMLAGTPERARCQRRPLLESHPSGHRRGCPHCRARRMRTSWKTTPMPKTKTTPKKPKASSGGAGASKVDGGPSPRRRNGRETRQRGHDKVSERVKAGMQCTTIPPRSLKQRRIRPSRAKEKPLGDELPQGVGQHLRGRVVDVALG